MGQGPITVFGIYIKATPERFWEATTDGEIRSKYNFGSRVSSDWTPGSRYETSHPARSGLLGEGENLEVDPPRRLVQSIRALWSEDVKSEGTSRVTWEIQPVGDSCRLPLTTTNFARACVRATRAAHRSIASPTASPGSDRGTRSARRAAGGRRWAGG
jgi:uncharacterized protein YndB with AHSA1/START domain